MPRTQHVSAAGQHLWSSVGMALSEGDSLRGPPIAVSDGAGGAFVTWSDIPVLISGATGIVVQHLASNGSVAPGWPAAGLLIKQDAAIQSSQKTLRRRRGRCDRGLAGGPQQWFAQRLTAAGVRLWSPATGKDLGITNVISSWTFAGDGAGGLLAAVQDLDLITFENKVIDSVSTAPGTGVGPHRRRRASSPGGSSVTVAARRPGAARSSRGPTRREFFRAATGRDRRGHTGWPVDGAQVSDARGPGIVAADGTGGAYFAWLRFSGWARSSMWCRSTSPATERGRLAGRFRALWWHRACRAQLGQRPSAMVRAVRSLPG
jgi:hypothetical protein